MATKRKKTPPPENVGGSVQQSPGITAGRQRQERRIGSGNTRRGSTQPPK